MHEYKLAKQRETMFLISCFDYMNQILKYVSLSRLSLKDKDLLEQAYLQAFPASERRPWTDIVQPQYTVSLALAVYERGCYVVCFTFGTWRGDSLWSIFSF